jgi:hypothetical protein
MAKAQRRHHPSRPFQNSILREINHVAANPFCTARPATTLDTGGVIGGTKPVASGSRVAADRSPVITGQNRCPARLFEGL